MRTTLNSVHVQWVQDGRTCQRPMQGQLVMEELVLCLPQSHQTIDNWVMRSHIHLQGIHLQGGRLGRGALIGWTGQAHRAVGNSGPGNLLWSKDTSLPAGHTAGHAQLRPGAHTVHITPASATMQPVPTCRAAAVV